MVHEKKLFFWHKGLELAVERARAWQEGQAIWMRVGHGGRGVDIFGFGDCSVMHKGGRSIIRTRSP